MEWWVPGAMGGNNGLFSGDRVSVWEDEKSSGDGDGGGCTTM